MTEHNLLIRLLFPNDGISVEQGKGWSKQRIPLYMSNINFTVEQLRNEQNDIMIIGITFASEHDLLLYRLKFNNTFTEI